MRPDYEHYNPPNEDHEWAKAALIVWFGLSVVTGALVSVYLVPPILIWGRPWPSALVFLGFILLGFVPMIIWASRGRN